MFPNLSIPQIDPLSFWIGFVAGAALLWLLGQVRPLFRQWRAGLGESHQRAQERNASSLEERHRKHVLKTAQGMHLAAPLFALDEILLAPKLMAPPPRVNPGDPPAPEDSVAQTLPYMPAWPELAAIYQAPTLSLPEALSGGVNLVVTGQPGAGKTVALAQLASLSARKDPQMGGLQEAIPFLFHIADLNLSEINPKDLLGPIANAIAETAPLLDLPRLPNFVQYAFHSAQALLILDGLDELPPEDLKKAVAYLETLLKAHPRTRVLTSGCPEHIDGLLALGFAPLALIPWTGIQGRQFLQKWGAIWTRFISMEAWAQTGPEPVDPILLNAWLGADSSVLTPLEFTLKVWAAYAGDGRGDSVLDAIESHLLRLAPKDIPVAALETLAMQANLSAQPIFDAHIAREWVRSFEPPEERVVPEESEEETPKKEKKSAKSAAASPGLLPKMAASGLLVSHLHNRMCFCHTVLSGYLAGRALRGYEVDQKMLAQPLWSGWLSSMHYFAALGDASRLVESFLESSRLPLHQHLLAAGRWLRDAPPQAAWRGRLLMALAKLLQSKDLPLGLRGQAAAAIALSRDPGAGTLFRQFLDSGSSEAIRLAALGSGAAQDAKAVSNLAGVLSMPDYYARRAACLALVAIGSTPALEAVATSLLNGDEDLRRAAAEALANDPQEGCAMLKDGADLSDILVRRAVVYGLGRVPEDWAGEMLGTLQVEDDQWVVRNAASQAYENRTKPNPSIPRPLTVPSETPWLITFAGTQGMGISPGSPATDILLLALKSDNMDERLAALPYLCQTPSEGVVRNLYEVMDSDEPEMREAAFQAVRELSLSGAALPDPRQFGLS